MLEMLVKKLGKIRMNLLDSYKYLSDDQLNQNSSGWTISKILYHLYRTEKETAQLILKSLHTETPRADDKDLSYFEDCLKKAKTTYEPPENYFTKKEITHLLEESRFRYTQAIFNKTHEETLVEKSISHPSFGVISLKNLLDFIWLHEYRHMEQINEIKKQLLQ